MEVKSKHPENNRSDFLLFVIIICAFGIFIYHVIPFLHQPLDEKPPFEEDYIIKKGNINIEEKTVLIALERYILYRVPECLIDFEIKLRRSLDQDRYFDDSRQIVWDISPPAYVEMRIIKQFVKNLDNKECSGDIKMLGVFTFEYDSLKVLEPQLIAKMFNEAETAGANWVYKQHPELQKVSESQAITLGSNIKTTSTY